MVRDEAFRSGGDHVDEPRDWREGLPVLTTAGVTLRELQRSDAESLCAMLATDDVGRFMSTPPDTPSGFLQFMAWVQDERRSGRCFCYGIVPESRTDAVGLIQFRQLDPDFRTGEWGFAIGQPFWGTGLFVASARLAVDFAFREVGVGRLEARAAVPNGRAHGALRKLGATAETTLHQSLVSRHGRADQVLWTLIAHDWLRAHPGAFYRRDAPLMPAPDVPGTPPSPRPLPPWRPGLPAWPARRPRPAKCAGGSAARRTHHGRR